VIPIALTLIVFTAPGGTHLAVNPLEVSSLRERLLTAENPSIKCVINLADGRSLAVIESCKVVYEKLNGK
jgi:hypothetical protein